MDLFKGFGRGKENVEIEFIGPFLGCVVEKPSDEEVQNVTPACFHSQTSNLYKVTVSKEIPEHSWTIVRHMNDFTKLYDFLNSLMEDSYKPPAVGFPQKKFVEHFGLPLSSQQEQERGGQLKEWMDGILMSFSQLDEETKGQVTSFFNPPPEEKPEVEEEVPVEDPKEGDAPVADEKIEEEDTKEEEAQDPGNDEEKPGVFETIKRALSGLGEEESKAGPPEDIQAYMSYCNNPNPIDADKLVRGQPVSKHYVSRDRNIKPRPKTLWLSLLDPPTLHIDSTKRMGARKGIPISSITSISRGYQSAAPEDANKTVVINSPDYIMGVGFETEAEAEGFEITAKYLRYCSKKGLDLSADNSEYRES